MSEIPLDTVGDDCICGSIMVDSQIVLTCVWKTLESSKPRALPVDPSLDVDNMRSYAKVILSSDSILSIKLLDRRQLLRKAHCLAILTMTSRSSCCTYKECNQRRLVKNPVPRIL